jgi:hypothetical protein
VSPELGEARAPEMADPHPRFEQKGSRQFPRRRRRTARLAYRKGRNPPIASKSACRMAGCSWAELVGPLGRFAGGRRTA